jgi:hypothetical protein
MKVLFLRSFGGSLEIMNKFSSAFSPVFFAVILTLFLPAVLFAQAKKIPSAAVDLESESKKYVKEYWARKIAQCGEYSYMIRDDRANDPQKQERI